MRYPQKISQKIIAMAEADQKMRYAWIEKGVEAWDDRIDQQNLRQIKRIVKGIGWPKLSVFGEEVCHSAWLLVQHAHFPSPDMNFDLEFASHCLGLMKALPAQEVLAKDMAYLEDRIRVDSGQPQLYGTQGWANDDSDFIYLYPIQDFAGVGERRKAAGMEPLSEYINDLANQNPQKPLRFGGQKMKEPEGPRH